ncbi:MAG TPA: efflux RND transporter periplasmic adaptor subunit [Anaeromyxobacter sp.]
MTTTNENAEPTSSRRRFGAASLALAVSAAAIAASGGTWLLVRRGADGHDHGAEGAAVAEAKERWQCPMHPSIVQDHPGDCPICGMKLVKVSAGPATPAGSGGAGGAAPATSGAAADQKELWQCPMHPSVVQDHPGDCPICGMRLVKVEHGGDGGPAPEGLSGVTIDPQRQQLIGMKIAHVERGPVGGAWRTSGRVAIDETRVHHVNVKFSGFMEHVHANFVGRPVKRGEPIFSIYSPELLAAQQEFLLAIETRKRLSSAGGMTADGDSLVQAARRKLELWDVPASEIDRIERTGQTTRALTFYSPASGVLTKKDVVPGMRVNAGDMPFEIVDLSRVWVLADAYESDLHLVRLGMPATLSLKAFPARTFTGRVAFIDPLLDPRTRTAKVRVEFANPSGELKPEMFGDVVFQGAARQALRVPADAIIHSGTRSVVFVALPDGKFQPREVQVGEGNSEWVEIASGVRSGDGVVTRANFLVDSESRLRASLDALPGAGAAPSAEPAAAQPAPAAPGGAPAPSSPAAADPHAGHQR